MAALKDTIGVEKVKVSCKFDPPLVLVVNSKSEKQLNGTALVRVEAPAAAKSRAPIDVVAVLDVSSSMGLAAAPPAEKPTRLDLLKKAMKLMITELDDGDHLGIVAFSDNFVDQFATDINHDISGDARTSAQKKVDRLVAKGGTIFKSGLKQAVKILNGRQNMTRQGFIVLLSDGLDSGEWSDQNAVPVAGEILRRYPVHTFGLGKAHDPMALHFIAKESHGTYSSISDNLNSKIVEAFSACLAGLKTVVAVNTRIDIKRHYEMHPTIVRIDSGGFQSFVYAGIPSSKMSGYISVGVLYAGEVKDFIVHIRYTLTKMPTAFQPFDLFAITGYYEDIPLRRRISIDECMLAVAICPTLPSGNIQELVLPCPMILQQMVRFRVLDFLNCIIKEIQALRKLPGYANEKVNGDDPAVQNIWINILQKMWEEFKKSDESWMQAQRVGLDVGRMEDDIETMVSHLTRGLGLGCVCSWVSSYQMQRGGTAFLTPAMKEMVTQARRLSMEEQGQPVAIYVDNSPPSRQGNLAMELVDKIDKRFELWCKLDREVPPTYSVSTMQDRAMSSSLTAALRENIDRAMQHDIYMAAVDAISEWRGERNSRKDHTTSTRMLQALPPVVTRGRSSTASSALVIATSSAAAQVTGGKCDAAEPTPHEFRGSQTWF